MTVKTENTQSLFPFTVFHCHTLPPPSKSAIEDAHLKPKTHIPHCFLNEPSSLLFKSNLSRTTTNPRKPIHQSPSHSHAGFAFHSLKVFFHSLSPLRILSTSTVYPFFNTLAFIRRNCFDFFVDSHASRFLHFHFSPVALDLLPL